MLFDFQFLEKSKLSLFQNKNLRGKGLWAGWLYKKKSIIWKILDLPKTLWLKLEGIMPNEREFQVKSLRKFKNPTPTQPEYPQNNQLFITGRTIQLPHFEWDWLHSRNTQNGLTTAIRLLFGRHLDGLLTTLPQKISYFEFILAFWQVIPLPVGCLA